MYRAGEEEEREVIVHVPDQKVDAGSLCPLSVDVQG